MVYYASSLLGHDLIINWLGLNPWAAALFPNKVGEECAYDKEADWDGHYQQDISYIGLLATHLYSITKAPTISTTRPTHFITDVVV